MNSTGRASLKATPFCVKFPWYWSAKLSGLAFCKLPPNNALLLETALRTTNIHQPPLNVHLLDLRSFFARPLGDGLKTQRCGDVLVTKGDTMRNTWFPSGWTCTSVGWLMYRMC